MSVEPVITAEGYLRRLAEGAHDRRFTGDGEEAFAVWRQSFLAWLRDLLAPHGAAAAPPVPPHERRRTAAWRGGRRTELRFLNPAFDLTVPVTVLEPEGGGNGAGVLCQHGHGQFGRLPVIGDDTTPGKATELAEYSYDFGLRLAAAGYTVIAIDLINFGERAMPSPPSRDRCDMLGLWMGLFGANLVAQQLSDIRCAFSILAEWEGVDPGRIGMCGLSQGGRMTMYATALDDRIKAAVASGACNTCRDRVTLASGLCGAQIVPGLMPHADHPDIFASIAPRPLQVQWGRDDPLVIPEYAEPGIDHIKRAYAAAGVADRLGVDTFDGGHEFHFATALEWFGRWL